MQALENIVRFLNSLPWSVVIILCLTLGLAPFRPPHLMEKLAMLVHGDLKRPIDIFDLILHGSPWMVLLLKLLLTTRRMS